MLLSAVGYSIDFPLIFAESLIITVVCNFVCGEEWGVGEVQSEEDKRIAKKMADATC